MVKYLKIAAWNLLVLLSSSCDTKLDTSKRAVILDNIASNSIFINPAEEYSQDVDGIRATIPKNCFSEEYALQIARDENPSDQVLEAYQLKRAAIYLYGKNEKQLKFRDDCKISLKMSMDFPIGDEFLQYLQIEAIVENGERIPVNSAQFSEENSLAVISFDLDIMQFIISISVPSERVFAFTSEPTYFLAENTTTISDSLKLIAIDSETIDFSCIQCADELKLSSGGNFTFELPSRENLPLELVYKVKAVTQRFTKAFDLRVNIGVYDRISPLLVNGNEITVSMVSESSVDLSWSLAEDNHTSQNSLIYDIYISEEAFADDLDAWKNLATLAHHSFGLSHEKTISNLNADTRYYVNIEVKDNFGMATWYKGAKFKTLPNTAEFLVEHEALTLGSPSQKKSFYSELLKEYCLFYLQAKEIKWTCFQDPTVKLSEGTVAVNARSFDLKNVSLNGMEFVFILVETDTYDVVLYKASSSTSLKLNFLNPVPVFSKETGTKYFRPTLALDENNKIWAGAVHSNSEQHGQRYVPRIKRSQNSITGTMATWTDMWELGSRTSYIRDFQLEALDNDRMYALINHTAIEGYLFDGSSWSIPENQGGKGGWHIFNDSSVGGTLYNMASYEDKLIVSGTINPIEGNILASSGAYTWDGIHWEPLTKFGTSPSGYFFKMDDQLYNTTLGYYQLGIFNGVSWKNFDSPKVNWHIYSVTKYHDEIYIVGGFTAAAGDPYANYIAKWNGSSWQAVGKGLGFIGTGLCVANDKLYISGYFESIPDIANSARIVAWNGTNYESVGDGISNGYAYKMTYFKDKLIVTGSFTANHGDANQNIIASWDGSTWAALGPGLSNTVSSLYIKGDLLYVGGAFTDVAGDSDTDYLASWDGSTWNSVITNLNGNVIGIEEVQGKLHIGGNFTNVGNDPNKNNVIFFNGSSWEALGQGSQQPNNIKDMLTNDGNLVFAGEFTSAANNTNISGIGLWNGVSFSALGTGLTGKVNSIAQDENGGIYAGGLFSDAGGIPENDNISYWNGVSWQALDTGLNNEVLQVYYDAPYLYAAGKFTDAGGNTDADYIAKWNGTAWSAIASGINASVNTLAKYNGDLYIGGTFTDAGGDANADRVAYFNGTNWQSLGTDFSGYSVSDLTVFKNDLYVAGNFSSPTGAFTALSFARWNGSIWSDVGDISQLNAYPQRFRVLDQDTLWLFGYQSLVQQPDQRYITAWDGSNHSSLYMNYDHFYQPNDVEKYNNQIFVSGTFSRLGGFYGKGMATYNPNALEYGATRGLSLVKDLHIANKFYLVYVHNLRGLEYRVFENMVWSAPVSVMNSTDIRFVSAGFNDADKTLVISWIDANKGVVYIKYDSDNKIKDNKAFALKDVNEITLDRESDQGALMLYMRQGIGSQANILVRTIK